MKLLVVVKRVDGSRDLCVFVVYERPHHQHKPNTKHQLLNIRNQSNPTPISKNQT